MSLERFDRTAEDGPLSPLLLQALDARPRHRLVARTARLGQNLRVTGSDSTRWSLIRQAADGDGDARAAFARRYEPVIRAYLGARWRESPLVRDLEDACQEVFVACYRDDGVLSRVDPERSGGFRAYLFGTVRNVARRFEEQWTRRARQPDSRIDLAQIEGREEPLSRVFDVAWAKATVRRAVRLLSERARDQANGARRRVELLKLRFREDLPIREIAVLWDEDPSHLHHEYAKARREFASALRDAVRENHPGEPERVDAECARLADYLA